MRRRWCGKGGFLALLGGFIVAGAGDARAGQPAGAMAEVVGELDKGFAVGPVGAAPNGPWWEEFQVEALTEWINAALSDNHSLQAAWERARAARQGSHQVASVLLPSVQAQGGYSQNSTEGLLQQLAWQNGGEVSDAVLDYLGDQYETYSWSVAGTWVLDLFGVSTNAWLASRWDAAAANGQREAQSMAVASQVGLSVFDWMTAREILALVEAQVAAQEELMSLTESRFARSEAAGLDVLLQRQQLAATKAALPGAQAQVLRAKGFLAMLLGKTSADLEGAESKLPESLPVPRLPAGMGTPGDLLDARPDLRIAAAGLNAADRRKVSAWMGLLPTVALSGSTGDAGQKIGADSDWQTAGTWSVGVSASIPLFSGGRQVAAARGATAAARAALYDFQGLALNAVREVEDAWTTLESAHAELGSHETQAEAAREAAAVAKDLYLSGVLPYLNLLSAQQALQQAELTLVTSQRNRLAAHVNFNDALGARWALSRNTSHSKPEGVR